MDPDALLEELLSDARYVVEHMDAYPDRWGDDNEMTVGLALQIVALHEWIVKDGFLPKAWNKEKP